MCTSARCCAGGTYRGATSPIFESGACTRTIGASRRPTASWWLLRGRRKRLLPLPKCRSAAELPDFEAKLATLRALHRRHAPASAPRTDRVPVISARTAGRTWAGSLALCVLLLAGAGTALAFVPAAETEKSAWEAAVPCTAATPAAERTECLTTLRAEIERTDANQPKQRSWLYFAEGRPLERLGVSREAALDFEAGDRVELTVWRRQVREVSGAGHIWREHFPGAGDVLMVAAGCVLAAGLPGARILMRLRAGAGCRRTRSSPRQCRSRARWPAPPGGCCRSAISTRWTSWPRPR